MSATATIITAPFLSVFGTDLSARCKSVTVPFGVDEVETTTGGDAIHIMVPGLENASLTAVFLWNDTIDSLLWSNKGTTGTIIVRRDTGAAATTNPQYTVTGFANSWPLVTGEVGEAFEIEVNFSVSSTLARATA